MTWLFAAACAVVLLVEVGITTTRAVPASSADQGSQRWIVASALVCIPSGFALGLHDGVGSPAFVAGGVAMMLAGAAFRWWSVATLGRHFTVHVAIHDDHQLITHGPYRWLRHPSYTGILVVLLGAMTATGNGVCLLFMAPILLAILHRIRIEEQALSGAFGDRYAAFRASTKRLIPGVW